MLSLLPTLHLPSFLLLLSLPSLVLSIPYPAPTLSPDRLLLRRLEDLSLKERGVRDSPISPQERDLAVEQVVRERDEFLARRNVLSPNPRADAPEQIGGIAGFERDGLTPVSDLGSVLEERNEEPPYFPHNIESCKNCEPGWPGISNCAAGAVVFQNASNLMWNPLAFIDQIKCACTDTFQSAFPQCADCFVKTHQCQTYLGLNDDSTPGIINNVRSVCAFGSGIFGGVASSYYSDGHSYATTFSAWQPDGNINPTSTYYGPGGIDYGSEQGAEGAASSLQVHSGVATLTAALGFAALAWML